MTETRSWLETIECSNCGKTYDPDTLLTVCDSCGKVLLARYDLVAAAKTMTKEALRERPWNLWRYHEIMPVRDSEHRLTLGEGGTPLLSAPTIGAEIGLSNLLIKDEGRNPTGSFKARGLGAAISRARELGVKAVALPSAVA